MLADKEINRAKEAYKEALDWYQQSDGVVFRSSVDGESQRSLEAGSLSSTLSLSELLGETISDGGPEHLHHTYKQLKEAADQLETLHEASHAWKQINEIQTEVSELNDKLSNKEVDKAKEAFKHFLDRYEQGRDGQIFKQSLERACESLKSIVEKDLREYWSEEDKFFETHFKDISKKHNNNMEIFGFEEDKPRLKHLFDESLKDKNFAQAREYINWLAEANDYLEEMKKHRLPPIPEE
jgi:molecular chaperone DnaK (HSP70)